MHTQPRGKLPADGSGAFLPRSVASFVTVGEGVRRPHEAKEQNEYLRMWAKSARPELERERASDYERKS